MQRMNVGAGVGATEDHGVVSTRGRFEIHAASKHHVERREVESSHGGVGGIQNVRREIGFAAEELEAHVQTIGSDGACRWTDEAQEPLLDASDRGNSRGRGKERQEEVAQRAGIAGETG